MIVHNKVTKTRAHKDLNSKLLASKKDAEVVAVTLDAHKKDRRQSAQGKFVPPRASPID